MAFSIENHHGNGVVVVDNAQHQVEVGVFVGKVKRSHCFGPNFHFVAFFDLEVACKHAWHGKWCHNNNRCHHHKDNFCLPNSVCPLHTLITRVLFIYCVSVPTDAHYSGISLWFEVVEVMPSCNWATRTTTFAWALGVDRTEERQKKAEKGTLRMQTNEVWRCKRLENPCNRRQISHVKP